MAISIDGPNKTIILSSETTFLSKTMYRACVDWSVLSENMQHLLPMTAGGHLAVVSGVYSDDLFVLDNGYKLQPEGYAPDTQITISGTLSTSDNTQRAIPPTVGSPVQFEFMVATYGTVSTVSVGSGLSQEEHDRLMDEVATQNDIIIFGG